MDQNYYVIDQDNKVGVEGKLIQELKIRKQIWSYESHWGLSDHMGHFGALWNADKTDSIHPDLLNHNLEGSGGLEICILTNSHCEVSVMIR